MPSLTSFNLAIEMLVISGRAVRIADTTVLLQFQSRNRDACHFRWPGPHLNRLFQSFNLAIEMLVISGYL